MKLTFLEMRTQRQLRKNRAERTSISFKKARHVGLLFTIEDRKKHDYIKKLIHNLELEGKKIEAFAFLPPQKENYDFLFDFFTPEDISFWGAVKSERALRFADTPFDYLLCLDQKPKSHIRYLLARSRARCRAGAYSEELQPFFELMVNGVKSNVELIDQLYQYTSKLK